MIEQERNLFSHPCRVRVLTTNGTVRRDGVAVMGRGVAEQAVNRYGSALQRKLGSLIRQNGNVSQVIGEFRPLVTEAARISGRPTRVSPPFDLLVSMPVKHNWYERADLALIRRSAEALVAVADRERLSWLVMPRPGCGNGKLDWEDVRPVVADILDDRFIVVFRPDSFDERLDEFRRLRSRQVAEGLEEAIEDAERD